MVNCTYTLKGTQYASYSDLLNFLADKALDLENISDIVYSKVLKQEQQVDRILKSQRDYKPKTQVSSEVSDNLNGEPSIEGRMAILDYIDSPTCAINGRRLVTPITRDEYINASIAKMMKDTSLKYTQEECRAIVEDTVKHWDIIQEDSILLHGMFTDKTISDRNAQDIDFINNQKDKIKDTRLNDTLLKQLFNGLKKTFYIKEKGKYPGSYNLTNINLTSSIKDSSQEIFGHIDYLFVGEDGTLHLYLFKTTSEHPNNWANVKEEKYKYQLAFLKHMLANNGINVQNIDLNIVPVQLTYDEKYTKLKSVQVLNAISYSTRYSGAEYAMAKYDRQVEAFIENNSVIDYVPEKVVDRADTVNSAIFPELNIKKEGYIGQSARMWIAKAPNIDPTGTEPLVIREVDDGYEVVIKGVTHKINSRKSKNKNQEILDLVSKYVSELEDYKGYSTQRLKEALRNSFQKGFLSFGEIRGFEGSTRKLEGILGKYFSEYEKASNSDKKVYDWVLLDDLIDANVLIFKNRKSGVVDIISISAFDLNSEVTLNKGKNLLGSYVYDTDLSRSELNADWGNIEAVRAMELLNESLPGLLESGEKIKLGTIGVLSAVGDGSFRRWDLGQFNKDYFQNVIKVVNRENPKLEITNNFKNAEFVNPIDTILQEYQRIMEGKAEFEQNRLSYYGFDQLTQAETVDQQIKALQYIMAQIYGKYKAFSDPKEVQDVLRGSNGTDKEMAQLLNLVTKAYLNITGESPKYQNKLQPIDEYLFTATTVPDPNIQIVVNNLQITHDAIASEFLQRFDRSIFDDFYKKIGYTNVQNVTLGNQAQQFKNLYEIDLHTGKKTMSFKNPYDYNNDLKPEERELLKKVLFQIAWINTNGNFKYSGWNDPKLSDYVKEHPEYLWVPLIRASKATGRQSTDAITAKLKNSFKRLRNATERFDEFVNGITPEERELLGADDSDFYKLRLRNPFELSMLSSNSGISETIKSRQRLLENYGPEFFETNVENILIEFLVKHISTTQFNKLLVGSKALLLQLHLTGDYGGNTNTVKKEIEWLQKYLKINVFNTSIMSQQEKKIVGCISPVRVAVSHMLLGGNIVGAFRDLVEGAQQNFMRAVIKFNTDLTPSNVAKAYAYVSTHATSDAMAVNLLSKLCLKYRLSNTDVGRIAERAKSGRNGIFNYDTWLYGTLRSPDFMNRMTLFVARCMQDGVWDAFSINGDNDLKYNWKKDKRFEIYAQGLTTHPEYKKQKAAYFSAIRQYNSEHPSSPVDPEDGLPSPYSNEQVVYIRNLGDNIYGSYDKGKRAMAENTSLGIVFGMFSTWFNGIVNNYFMKPQKNGAFGLQEVQETDEQGRPLFYDEHGGITIEDTGMKVTKNIPIIVQGIFPTLGVLVDIFRKTEGGLSTKIEQMRKYLNADQHEKANMRKLLSDLLMWLLFSMLFKLAITPEYKEHKKSMEDNPLLVNMVTEVLYKSTSRAYDQYKGPINIIQFFGENMNPPTYSQPTQLISDAAQALFGEKSWKYLLFDSSGFTRSFRDSGFAYIKSVQE